MKTSLLSILAVVGVSLSLVGNAIAKEGAQVESPSALKAKKKKNTKCLSRNKNKLKGSKTNKAFMDLSDDMCRELEDMFPNLHKTRWAVLTWKQDGSYNCFAWSVGIKDRQVRFSEINPNGSPENKHWDAFYKKHGLKKAFAKYKRGAKVLLFGDDSIGHAAVRSKYKINGMKMYESKLGYSQRIVHTKKGLSGGQYGKVLRSYK